jgi:hypothetical protein
MATPTKTDQTVDLFALQSVAAGSFVKDSVQSSVDVSGKFAVELIVDFAPIAATASPTATEWRLETKAPGLASWVIAVSRLSNVTQATTNNITTGTAGSNTLAMASVTNLTVGQICFCYNAGTPASSEWVEIVGISGTTVTLADNLINAQSGNVLWNRAERFVIELPLTTKRDIRFSVNNNRGTNRNIYMRAKWRTLDSVG